jgi:hypothetical protein
VLEELSDHIMDIAMNSVRAGARHVTVSVIGDRAKDLLTVTIVDDGTGMAKEVAENVMDPFYTTKEGKNVGLGVPLLKGATEMCNGDFHLRSVPGEGTEIEASFALGHPDLPPFGDVKETMMLLAVSNPEVRFSFRYAVDGSELVLDTRDVAEALGGVPINHPEVIAFLRRCVQEQP